MSIDKSPARLLARARSLADSIESPAERSNWDRDDIDAIGEAACMLHEKGLRSIDDQQLRLDWEIQFAKIFASLSFWRGSFALSWACAERLVKLLRQDPSRELELGIAYARAGSAASHYARFEASYPAPREKAFDRAEALFRHALPYSAQNEGEIESPAFSGLPMQAFILYEAARHWHLSSMSELSRLGLQKARELSPEGCEANIKGANAPKFWMEMHQGELWTSLANDA